MLSLVLPLKDFINAKQRLSGILAAHERRNLFQAMVEDVLSQLTQCAAIDQVLVVSDDPTAELLAYKYHFTLLKDERAGLNSAVSQARDYLNRSYLNRSYLNRDDLNRDDLNRDTDQAGRMLIVHGDIPLLTAESILAVLAHSNSNNDSNSDVVIASDVQQQGTNAMLLPVPNAFEFHYGVGSCQKHRLQAEQIGLSVSQIHVPELALDIDEPQDLVAMIDELLLNPARAPKTALYLKESGIASRLLHLDIIASDPNNKVVFS
jgi:2-phospho-L-lactate guanylyltransferase (CobY/MobA/RfbA family)